MLCEQYRCSLCAQYTVCELHQLKWGAPDPGLGDAMPPDSPCAPLLSTGYSIVCDSIQYLKI